MRIDHFAYQRGTQVAGFGFFLQLIIAISLLIFARVTGPAGDTACMYGGLYAFVGLLVWISLIVVFNQHKLERLEALEEDELAQARETGGGGGRSMFETADDETRVAARRLRKMHQWMMPGVSLVLAATLGLLAWRMLSRLFLTNEATGETVLNTAVFHQTPAIGWAVAICLSFAAVSFIFSRFVAGMSKHSAWQNLRGGAGYLVGNALVLLAVAIGVIFRFFDEDPTKLNPVFQNIVVAIPILMIVQAMEILLNFVLNLYRPRIPGEVPRPAFDSRVLSMLAAPDSLVRSINEAVNYQFGFDVTSTWGYKLLTRSVIKLVVIGVVAMLVLSTLQVVEPQQQAVKLANGRIVGDRVHDAGLMFKLPWPLQQAEVHDVWSIREIALTPRRTEFPPVNAWVKRRGDSQLDVEDEPFLVGSSRFEDVASILGAAGPAGAGPVLGRRQETAADAVSESFALLNAEIILQYRIRAENDGLLEYLRFAPDTIGRRDSLTTRQKILRSLARREIGLYLSALTLDKVLARQRAALDVELEQRVQAAFDANRTGVKVVSVNIPLLQPAGQAVRNFEDLAIATQNLEEYKAKAISSRLTSLTYLLGDPEQAEAVVGGIKQFNEMARELGNDDPKVLAQRDAVEEMMLSTGGNAGQLIARAYADRWGELLSTRADAVRVAGQVEAFRAAPALYREREIMRVLKRQFRDQRRIVLGIDSSRVNIDLEFKDLSSMLDFAPSLADVPQETRKPMNKPLALTVGAVLLLLLLIFSTTYDVSFNEVAVRHTFGGATVDSVKTEPGLKWKWPIIQDSDTYDTRLQVQETALEEISTADGQQVLVKAFLLWRVDTSSPEATLAFDKRHDSMDEANGDLLDPFVTAMTGTMSEYRFQDLLGAENRLAEAESKVVQALGDLRNRGIVPVGVGISQLILPERTSNSVIRRMEATRARLAEAKRFQGTAYVDGLTAEGRTMADTILTFASLRAATIRAEAESKAAQYLEEMSEEEELAIFLVWLDTLEATLSRQSTFILEHNVAPYHLMSLSSQDGTGTIPQPATASAAPGAADRLAGETESAVDHDE